MLDQTAVLDLGLHSLLMIAGLALVLPILRLRRARREIDGLLAVRPMRLRVVDADGREDQVDVFADYAQFRRAVAERRVDHADMLRLKLHPRAGLDRPMLAG